MSLIRSIGKIQRITPIFKSPALWFRTMSSSAPAPTKPDEPKPGSGDSGDAPSNRRTYKTDNWDKRFLVWTGKYKSTVEVPEYVHQDQMERTRNQIRIRGSNIMIGLTILGCIIAIYSGKKSAAAGESVVKSNLDWHKKYNEENKSNLSLHK